MKKIFQALTAFTVIMIMTFNIYDPIVYCETYARVRAEIIAEKMFT